MKVAGKTYIAGWKTADEWKAFRKTLVPGADPATWEKAYDDYFHMRLSLRYLKPIKVLQHHGTFQGEGFAIVAIQCTLIEFLESTVEGRSYRYRRRGDPRLGPDDYQDSSDLFVRFLTKRMPFKEEFDGDLARDFYKNVRCGLLHEARTKGEWTIRAKTPNGKVVSAAKKTVYRDDFHAAILHFIDWYHKELSFDVSLQEAFIKKFDNLCT